MAYGFEIRDASGNIRLNASDKIGRIIFSQLVPQGSSGSITIADVDAAKTVGFAFPTDGGFYPHTVTISGHTIFWSNYAGYSSGPSIVMAVQYG